MSRAYQIEVREAFEVQARGQDRVESRLQLLQLLPAERLGALLCEELAQDGFSEKEGAWEKTIVDEARGQVRLAIDPQTGVVTVDAQVEKSGKFVATRRDVVWDNVEESRLRETQLRELAQQDAEGEKVAQADLARKLAASLLEESLPAIRDLVHKLTHRVTARALREKAEAMGRVQSIEEDLDSRKLTIILEI